MSAEAVEIRGARIPKLGFGTWQLTAPDCRHAVEHALELGYRHIDTAQFYGNETEIGAAIEASGIARESIFLTTKLWVDNLAPERVRDTTETSLRHLRTEYVDLLLVHWPSPEIPLEATLDAMLDLQQKHKVRHVGVSNFPPSLVARAAGHTPIVTNQVEYHPYLSQDRLLELARKHDHTVTAYSPLARGRVLDDPVLGEIAAVHGKTVPQVVLRWLIQQDRVVAIPKAASTANREANLAIFDFALSEDEMRRIRALDRNERILDPAGLAPNWER